MLVSHAKFHRALRKARVNHERPTAVVVGAGDVGSSVLRHLAGSGEFGELWALDIDVERAGVAVDDAVAIASYPGSPPPRVVAAADVLSVDGLATTLSHVSPDVIVQTTTLQSWWVITQLPQDLWRRLEREARFGPWLPFHLVPAASVLAAARTACPATPVVNVAFPDAVNAVLAALGTPAIPATRSSSRPASAGQRPSSSAPPSNESPWSGSATTTTWSTTGWSSSKSRSCSRSASVDTQKPHGWSHFRSGP
jgi:hypothetical protein